MDLRVGKHYQLLKKIGSGAFGEIYEGKQALFGLKWFCQAKRPPRANERHRGYQAGKCIDAVIDLTVIGTYESVVPLAGIRKQALPNALGRKYVRFAHFITLEF
jgi:hypothetical protein